MGFSASPVISKLYLFYALDRKLLDIAGVYFYKRFLDDIFCISQFSLETTALCSEAIEN